MGLRALHHFKFTCFSQGEVQIDGLKEKDGWKKGGRGRSKAGGFPWERWRRQVSWERERGEEGGVAHGALRGSLLGEAGNIRLEVGKWIRVCVCVSEGTHGGEEDKFKCTLYQHSFPLLVLSLPWRDSTLLAVSFVCVTLSNVTIMSSQIKQFHFITKLSVVQFQNFFHATHLPIMVCVRIWFIGYIIKNI